MANQTIIAAKAVKTAAAKELITTAQSVVIIDYRGLTVEEDTLMRAAFRNAGVEYSVIKNTIMERACADAGIDSAVNQLFLGPTAVAFGKTDPVAPAKIAKEFLKKAKKGSIKGGIVNGKVQNTQAIEVLADLPPREVLIARILGSMNAPITKLAVALNAIKEKQEGDASLEA